MWRVRLPEIAVTEQRYFTPEEVDKIIEAAEGQYKALFTLHYAIGGRFGELAGLHVEDIDFTNSIVYIRRSTFLHEEVTTKSKAGYREIDVDPAKLKIVKELIGDRQSGRVFESKNGLWWDRT